jgi:hypothetical protein
VVKIQSIKFIGEKLMVQFGQNDENDAWWLIGLKIGLTLSRGSHDLIIDSTIFLEIYRIYFIFWSIVHGGVNLQDLSRRTRAERDPNELRPQIAYEAPTAVSIPICSYCRAAIAWIDARRGIYCLKKL